MIKPLGHRVLIKAKEIEEKSVGGIILTSSETAKKLEKAGICEGVIVDMGPTAFRDFDKDYMPKWIRSIVKTVGSVFGKVDVSPSEDFYKWVEVGDHIYYAQYGGRYIVDPHTGTEYVILNDQDVMASISEE